MLPVLKFIMVFQKKNQLLRREKSPSMLLTNGDTASGAAAEAEVRSSCPTTRGGAPPR